MEPSDRIIELLEEIRDLQKSAIEETRARVAHSIGLQERAVRWQVIGMRVGGTIVVAGIAYLIYLASTR